MSSLRDDTHASATERRSPRAAAFRDLRLLVVPVAFLAFAIVYPMGKFHWDVLERSYVVDHPLRFLKSFDGSPRCLFLHFAHVLELPFAAAFGAVVPGISGIALLQAFEAFVSFVTLWIVGRLVLLWRAAPPEETAPHLPAAMVAQAVLATSLAFWKMGSGGEEKILALATQLLFLACFWRSLASTPRPSAPPAPADPAPSRWAALAAVSLVVAVLSHLTGAVLIPYAAVMLLLARSDRRRAVAMRLAIACGVIAIAYIAIAALTVHARTPGDFWSYFTFYHHGVENFFEATGAPHNPGARIGRVLRGIATFFSGMTWDGFVPCGVLSGWLILSGLRALRRPSPPTAENRAPGRTSGWRPRLAVHVAVLAALWTCHFTFFEPDKFESWTLVCALAIVTAAAYLPSGRRAWLAVALPVFLLGVNIRHYRWNHEPINFHQYLEATVRASRPNDLLLMVGGRQDGQILRGSLWTRYFLAFERQRQVVSLYDATGLTEPEYWGRPFASAAALQAAIDSGRRAWAPAFMASELKLLKAAGLLDVTWQAPTDSVIEITRVVEIPAGSEPAKLFIVTPDGTTHLDKTTRVGLLPHRAIPGMTPPGAVGSKPR